MVEKNLQVTVYKHTGYSISNEPASDAVIAQNESVVLPVNVYAKTPWKLEEIKLDIEEDDVQGVDYIKAATGSGRWYYYVTGYKAHNSRAITVNVALDYFATVGLANMSFFGNIARRSLTAAEAAEYPLLPEPWAPRRPLKTRRVILNLNVNKSERLPSRITQQFEQDATAVSKTEAADVPTNPIGSNTTRETLSISATLPMIYPVAAAGSSHQISTPWGNIPYTTPYEQYFQLSGAALSTFLANAKKANALDLLSNPYYLPAPAAAQTVALPELSTPGIKNKKARKYYTTLTIRSLAANSTRTFSDNDTDLEDSQPLAVIIVPDKSGGIYVLPSTIRDTGLSAYAYLEGVYSPFETITYNAAGDTPAKFAADGTVAMNTALADLFQTYAGKINADRYRNLQAAYLKDIASHFGTAVGIAQIILATSSHTGGSSSGVNGTVTSSGTYSSDTDTESVFKGVNATIEQVKGGGMGNMYEAPDGSFGSLDLLKTALLGSHQNDIRAFMLGNINDYLNRYAALQNDLHNSKVANLFKNITLVGNHSDANKLAGQYEILVASLQPADEINFDLFLQHFGHAVDEYSDVLVKDAGGNFNYVMVGDDAVLTNTVRADANAPILAQLRTGVRVWKTPVRVENF